MFCFNPLSFIAIIIIYHGGLCWRWRGLVWRGLLLRWLLLLLIGCLLSWGWDWLLLIGSSLLLWHHGLRCCGDCWYARLIVLHPRDRWDGWLIGEWRPLTDHSCDWWREGETKKFDHKTWFCLWKTIFSRKMENMLYGKMHTICKQRACN